MATVGEKHENRLFPKDYLKCIFFHLILGIRTVPGSRIGQPKAMEGVMNLTDLSMQPLAVGCLRTLLAMGTPSCLIPL